MRQMQPKRNFSISESMDYLGVKRRWFDEHIRPRVTSIRCGTSELIEVQDLDRAWDDYVASLNKSVDQPGDKLCVQLKQEAFNASKTATKSTKFFEASAFSSAASKVLLMQKRI